MIEHLLLCSLASVCIGTPIAIVTRMPPIWAGIFGLGLNIIFSQFF